MPPVHEYHCDTCDFSMPSGWGEYLYVRAKVCSTCGETVDEIEDTCGGCGTPTEEVEADGYERVVCPHPGEQAVMRRVLGEDDPSSEKRRRRTGFNAHCVCLDCLAQFDLDTDRDERRCPDCDSDRVKTQSELVGEDCPSCSDGTFIQGEMVGMA